MTAPDKAALLALADRVEALTGPCRETDQAILKALWDCRGKSTDRGPKWTASLDAAMTLIPNGHEWFVNWCGNSVANVNALPDGCPVHCGYAPTPALALTAAALRAKAAS